MSVTLTLRRHDLVPATITRRLGIKPSEYHEPWHPDTADDGTWILEPVAAAEKSLEAQLAELLDVIEPRAAELEKLYGEGYDVSLSVRGDVDADTVTRLAQLGVPLVLAP